MRTVAWDDLDRDVEPDHLTSLYVPVLAAPVAGEVARFAELVRTLRERCPWDREQTHATLTRHLLEETYEVLEAIDELDGAGGGDDGYGHLEEELGDLLFQVVFHATLAAEEGKFTLADVARGIHDKLVHRHPHVFGEVQADTAGQVMQNWERIKQAEKGRTSLMEGIARRPAVAAVRPQGPAQGRVGGAGAGAGAAGQAVSRPRTRGRCCSRRWTGSGGAGSTPRPPCGPPPPGSGTVSRTWNARLSPTDSTWAPSTRLRSLGCGRDPERHPDPNGSWRRMAMSMPCRRCLCRRCLCRRCPCRR